MGQLTVRKVDDELFRRLKIRAAEHGRSAEAEHREILKQALLPEAADLDAALAWATKQATALTVPVEVRPFQHGGTA